MRRCLPLVILLVALCAAPASAKVRQGPAGVRFYTPPTPLPAGKHGALIWQRGLVGQQTLKNAASNRLLLYRSTSVDGKPTAVSGTLALPKGRAPAGGWPVITWAHGTTGIADTCAPTRAPNFGNYDHPLLQRWLKAGYAVVRTDYEGLGTPGPHPYLIGVSEGRSVLDAVLAARALEPGLSRNVVIAGHSQGGHAALWAASLAPKWTPGLRIRGTVAFAPASHIGEQGALLRGVTAPGALTGFVALIVRGIDVANPGLHVASLLTPEAAALYPQTDAKCLGPLSKPDSFGALAPSQLFRADAVLDPIVAALNANDPEDLIFHTPLQIEQGKADTTVFPAFSDQLDQSYTHHSVAHTYKTYPGVDHGGVVTSTAPQRDATAFIKKRFG
jgi:pimeloyl-ACP methyl ester carboxylesterase